MGIRLSITPRARRCRGLDLCSRKQVVPEKLPEHSVFRCLDEQLFSSGANLDLASTVELDFIVATAVTPKVVRDIIVRALASGWIPDGGGSAFHFDHPLIENQT